MLSWSSDSADFQGFLVHGRVLADGTTAARTFTGNGESHDMQ